MFSEQYRKLNEDIERKAQQEKESSSSAKTKQQAHQTTNSSAKNKQSSSSSSSTSQNNNNKKLTQEEALRKIREKVSLERKADEFEAGIKYEMAKAQAAEQGNISRGDAMRFNQSKGMNAKTWKSFGLAFPIFGLSLSFVGFALYYQAGMWQREEDLLVCVNCARQKEIAEEIYFGKSAKVEEEKSRKGRMMP